ncbi:zinc-binding metallopeptidase family protein [Oceaniglobus roseus]|uniref:zinc-binding metallopeptidase family protein n=1 Tax=Oceaniglobus roseus TaxID=1737570 RepID=UPI000C7F3C64|nr:putative zinc-binding metallopeptidase [Kandeliimicrobium roseum]
MKRFACKTCGNEVYFDNQACLSCGNGLAYDPNAFDMVSLAGPTPPLVCANAGAAGCNWIVTDPAPETFCTACRHNRTVPDISSEENRELWAAIELAKRQLFYSLMRWNLPMPTKEEDPANGLAFDFLADTVKEDGTTEPVMTGHAEGLITLNIAEGDDAEREQRRTSMGEPYRTLVGHMRHEVGHYYWDRLVRDSDRIDEFRALFGDEREDYGAALKRHYESGPPADWMQAHVSTYATAHAWEDWAETWAHWIHMIDGLETAWSYGITCDPRAGGTMTFGNMFQFDPYAAPGAQEVVDAWVPLTIAINSVNRSLGQPDLYPFVLSTPVMEKLGFIHSLIAAYRG